jgi:hypothetical protein
MPRIQRSRLRFENGAQAPNGNVERRREQFDESVRAPFGTIILAGIWVRRYEWNRTLDTACPD